MNQKPSSERLNEESNSTTNPIVIEVTEYKLIDDANYYQHHMFSIQLWVDQTPLIIERSYAAFCELDCKLRRQYPRTNIPTLNLAGLPAFKKKVARKYSILASGGSTIPNNLTGNEQMDSNNETTTSSKTKKLTKRIDSNEIMNHKKKGLTLYLQTLLTIPEILLNTTLLLFLDAEYKEGEEIPSEELTEEVLQSLEYSYLLNESNEITKTVRRDYNQTIQIDTNQKILIYSFESKHHDIGFQVMFNDEVIVNYQRYQAHEKKIYGFYEFKQSIPGKLQLIWDNSYSKWRSKTIVYQYQTMTLEQYKLKLLQIQEIKKIKLQYVKQRNTLKKLFTRLSTQLITNDTFQTTSNSNKNTISYTMNSTNDLRQSILQPNDENDWLTRSTLHERPSILMEDNHITSNNNSSTRDSIVLSSNDDSHPSLAPQETLISDKNKTLNLKEMYKEDLIQLIQQLINEKQTLRHTLSIAETALATERNACASNQQLYEDTLAAKDLIEEELIDTKQELETIRGEYHDHLMSLQIQPEERIVLTIDDLFLKYSLKEPISSTCALSHFDMLLAYSYQNNIDFKQTKEQEKINQEQISKLKNERKQLKQIGIQLKDKVDESEQIIHRLEHEKELLFVEQLQSKDRISDLEKFIVQAMSDPTSVQEPPKLISSENQIISEEIEGNTTVKVEKEQDPPSDNLDSVNVQEILTRHQNKPLSELEVESDEFFSQSEKVNGSSISPTNHPQEKPVVIIDFAKSEPDEMAQYFNSMTSSIVNIMKKSGKALIEAATTLTEGDEEDDEERQYTEWVRQQQAKRQALKEKQAIELQEISIQNKEEQNNDDGNNDEEDEQIEEDKEDNQNQRSENNYYVKNFSFRNISFGF